MKKLLIEKAFYSPPISKGRFISIFPDDTFIVSYPKSGNTWLLFMLGSLLNRGEPMDFKRVQEAIPDVYMFLNSTLKKRQRPRILKSHEYLHPQYPKVLYLVRDPREVAVSYYYYQIKLGKISEEKDLSSFIDDFIVGAVDRYGPWDRHVGGWAGAMKGDPNFHLVKYEDLKKNTESLLQEIADFLNIPRDKDLIERAISGSSMSAMKQAERETLNVGKREIPFVREGKTSSWENEIPKESLDKLCQKFGPVMGLFGYS